jgi:hypothetical protein
MNIPQTIDEYVRREIAALASGTMQVTQSYTHPALTKRTKDKNKALIEEIEASLKVVR